MYCICTVPRIRPRSLMLYSTISLYCNLYNIWLYTFSLLCTKRTSTNMTWQHGQRIIGPRRIPDGRAHAHHSQTHTNTLKYERTRTHPEHGRALIEVRVFFFSNFFLKQTKKKKPGVFYNDGTVVRKIGRKTPRDRYRIIAHNIIIYYIRVHDTNIHL